MSDRHFSCGKSNPTEHRVAAHSHHLTGVSSAAYRRKQYATPDLVALLYTSTRLTLTSDHDETRRATSPYEISEARLLETCGVAPAVVSNIAVHRNGTRPQSARVPGGKRGRTALSLLVQPPPCDCLPLHLRRLLFPQGIDTEPASDFDLAQDSPSLPPRSRRKPRKRPPKNKMSPHRAQQDIAGGPLSGAQVARSNETVNFLLGNRRPAWMTTQNEPASRSPHTNKGPTSRNRQGVHGVPIVPTQAPRRESSTNATNPPSVLGSVAPSAFRLRPHENLQDKSTAALETNQLITDCAAALPSPAPTDQPSPPTVTSNQTSHQIRETCLQSPELGLDFAANNSNATTAWTGETRAQETPANVLAQNFSGAGAGRAVPDLSNPIPLSTNIHSTSRFSLFEPSEHPALLTPSITLPGNPSSSVSASLPLVPDSQAAPSPTLNISSRPSSGQNSRPPAVPSPLNAGHHPPQPPGERQDVYSHAVQPAGTSRDALDSFLQVVMAKNLDSYISDRGGMAKLPEDGTTAPRVRLLKDAIEKADYFYIVLHQILCLWTLDTKAAQDLLGLPPDVTDSALGIVQNVLRKNENMGQDTIFFFANFPASSASGLWHTEVYRNHTGDISRFLNNLHEQWNRILVPAMRPHSGRGYPILADELRYQLKLRSPILETIFFTVTRRHTGVPDGLIADQMTALFRQDSQNDHTQMV
ncbi:MIZ/SP-RING zinc finger [Colletotrichum scovillei]|uniref:MIZ/SP-RING zinc finger n=1 Tax=Colletotrichum scovillei TaxID=1209932 RepID=A0A9P7RF43_9PEZI|nr:MIZ/SP-RING zinc finger [Colletotrichum scovillei]KAG7074961.1 MIZ/SP-RING zinc finger [Colletotrichum scovillei]KAG7082026.1 MIZ/SP-RING zinc finger [Colletotrichum scovillei]